MQIHTQAYVECRTYDLGRLLFDLTQQNTVELSLGDPERLADQVQGWERARGNSRKGKSLRTPF